MGEKVNMSHKGFYKKLTDMWFDDDKSQQRAREGQFYNTDTGEKVGKKPKSKAKPNPRADHKHEYVPVVIWGKSYLWGICGSVGKRCRICGKRKQNYTFFRTAEPRKYYGEMEHFWEDTNEELTPIDKTTYQKKIFLGGSQTVNELTVELRNELVNFMNLGYKFVIGDCKGEDLAIQKILAENEYKNVVVYYSGDRVRINLGGWEEKKVHANKFDTGYELYKSKDEQMAIDADEGFMILKGETRGTMANIGRLVDLNKKCRVAIPERKKIRVSEYYIRTVESKDDIEWLIGYLRARER